MAKSEIIGSWHNSGFHGHFRSKSRNDFIGEYRYLAKPVPPKAFVRRAQEIPSKHVFSKHDNRHSFMSDALYFEEGLGRRRLPNNSNHWQPDFLYWMPQKKELDKAGPQASMYKVSYRGIPAQPMCEKIIRRPKTSFDENLLPTTTYRYSHGNGNPNKQVLSVMNNEALKAVPQKRAKTPSHFAGNPRESVASCLTWYSPKKTTPAATQITVPAVTQTAPVNTAATPATAPAPLASTQ